jgi:hypothetical protein
MKAKISIKTKARIERAKREAIQDISKYIEESSSTVKNLFCVSKTEIIPAL